ncbi:uncharacterized [Tachysurus ichikawai]
MDDQQQALVIEAKDGLGPASGQSPEALPSSRSSGIEDLTLSRVSSRPSSHFLGICSGLVLSPGLARLLLSALVQPHVCHAQAPTELIENGGAVESFPLATPLMTGRETATHVQTLPLEACGDSGLSSTAACHHAVVPRSPSGPEKQLAVHYTVALPKVMEIIIYTSQMTGTCHNDGELFAYPLALIQD